MTSTNFSFFYKTTYTVTHTHPPPRVRLLWRVRIFLKFLGPTPCLDSASHYSVSGGRTWILRDTDRKEGLGVERRKSTMNSVFEGVQEDGHHLWKKQTTSPEASGFIICCVLGSQTGHCPQCISEGRHLGLTLPPGVREAHPHREAHPPTTACPSEQVLWGCPPQRTRTLPAPSSAPLPVYSLCQVMTS